MKTRNPLALHSHISLVLQSGQTSTGEPLAAKISLQRLSTYLLMACVAFAVLLAGTLLFFRELEINRKMQDHVLKLETEKRLYTRYPLADNLLEAAPATATAKELASVAAAPAKAAAPAVAAVAAATPAATPAANSSPPALVAARVSDLQAHCSNDNCQIKLGMVTTRPGTAVGKLLLVLEAEVPRIGGADPNAPMRKRYFMYPGHGTRDELDPNTLGQLDQKAFRFTRGLQTSTVFRMGKLLRPLAINAYVFDSERTLLQHERKAIEE